MKQQMKALDLIKQLKIELHGKLERSVELEVDCLIAQIEHEFQQEASKQQHDNCRMYLTTALGLLVKYLPEIKGWFDGR